MTKGTSYILYNTIETSENKSTKITWKETLSNGERRIAIQNQSYTEVSYGTDITNRWEYTVPSTGETMSVTVKDKEATILSSKKDPQVVNLFDSVLMYPPSFYAKDFLKSSKKKRYFWTINRKDVKLQQMVLIKLDKETITINDTPIECQKIEMKPTGFAGAFWKAYYWFDVSNGEFIQYSGKKGPPGTPDFLIQRQF